MHWGIGFVFMFMLLAIGGSLTLLLLAFWVWMLIDCAQNEPSEGSDKIVWVVIIVFTGWIGAFIYLLARRPQRKARFGK